MPTVPEAEVDFKEKHWNLSVELAQAELDKKETVKAHSDNIKRIKAEMKEIMEEEEAGVIAAQRPEAD